MKKAAGLAAVVAAVALTLTACAPGSGAGTTTSSAGPVSKDVAAAGKVTLTVWDQNVDAGIAEAQEALNKQFEAKYPNVTIERTAQSFADLKKTLRLALTSGQVQRGGVRLIRRGQAVRACGMGWSVASWVVVVAWDLARTSRPR